VTKNELLSCFDKDSQEALGEIAYVLGMLCREEVTYEVADQIIDRIRRSFEDRVDFDCLFEAHPGLNGKYPLVELRRIVNLGYFGDEWVSNDKTEAISHEVTLGVGFDWSKMPRDVEFVYINHRAYMNREIREKLLDKNQFPKLRTIQVAANLGWRITAPLREACDEARVEIIIGTIKQKNFPKKALRRAS